MKQLKVSKQAVNEILINHNLYKKTPLAAKRSEDMTGSINQTHWQPMRNRFLAGTQMGASEALYTSPILEKTSSNFDQIVQKVEQQIGLRLALGEEIGISREDQAVRLNAEGLRGVALFAKVFAEEMDRWGPSIRSSLMEERLNGPDAEHDAAAAVFLHLAREGIDGIFLDLKLSNKTRGQYLNELHKDQREFIEAVYQIQLNMVFALSDGAVELKKQD